MISHPLTSTHNLSMTDTFERRHIGPRQSDVNHMLEALGLETIDQLIDQTVPENIRLDSTLNLPPSLTESEMSTHMRDIANKNAVAKSYIGMGYYGTHTPSVILRNILENPGWYTQYTPYQAEISQGRLEALVNFQTVITELTSLPIANASLLDEGTAAAEAMALAHKAKPRKSTANTFFVSHLCHPQTIALIQTRAEPLGINILVDDHRTTEIDENIFGVLVQYPATNGDIHDYANFAELAHKNNALVICATDLLALTLLPAPADWGADIAVGSSQRFGVPMGYGGPHAGFIATTEKHKRLIPGRLIGVSVDIHGNPAMRLALQTREQHIRRDRATSNICTAQVLLAIMASMYAVYHGPYGLRRIAERVALLTQTAAHSLKTAGFAPLNQAPVFDTITVPAPEGIVSKAEPARINLRYNTDNTVGISFDETTTMEDLVALLALFDAKVSPIETKTADETLSNPVLSRQPDYLAQSVFNSYHSETEMLRYITKLQNRDLSLAHSMIPLGSCTMKLNATTEMIPITWPEFANLHPFAPRCQAKGYKEMIGRLESWLNEITGFYATSLQPNAGSQGEYAGLLCIRDYHLARGDDHRTICLIPMSAHGTNPASAIMAGMRVVAVSTDSEGNIDVDDLRAKADEHAAKLAAVMVTYPSTHGVFEASIKEVCEIIHERGGQVYMDGANMNAQVGLTSPGEIGADVCHLNLHKTFCIPHGGGGPGVGPICVAEHLAPFLPGHAIQAINNRTEGAVSSAPYGSAAILPISYAYIAMMGADGLTRASEIAILNANYIAKRLEPHFPVLYRGEQGWIAHECILDLRDLKESAGVTPEDVAKRLMDYGFHAPTMQWPVIGTLMIEPTESESLAELDRFCQAMIAIRAEIREIEEGRVDAEDNPLKNAPHTAEVVMADEWTHPYSRSVAAYPLEWVRHNKFWPFVSRVDNVHGDRNLVCTCEPMEAYA